MFQFLNFVANLFVLLPWWAALTILAAIPASLYLVSRFLMHRMHREIVAAVAEQGVPLTDALVSVHSAEPAEVPSGPAFDDDPDDEDFDPELDGNLSDDEADYYWLDATIAPVDPKTEWSPGNLSLVWADFEPTEELEATDRMGVLHTLEVLRGGEFVAIGDETVTGPQRLRLLFAVTKGLRDVKFAYHFTYFGRLTLPAGVVAHAQR